MNRELKEIINKARNKQLNNINVEYPKYPEKKEATQEQIMEIEKFVNDFNQLSTKYLRLREKYDFRINSSYIEDGPVQKIRSKVYVLPTKEELKDFNKEEDAVFKKKNEKRNEIDAKFDRLILECSLEKDIETILKKLEEVGIQL